MSVISNVLNEKQELFMTKQLHRHFNKSTTLKTLTTLNVVEVVIAVAEVVEEVAEDFPTVTGQTRVQEMIRRIEVKAKIEVVHNREDALVIIADTRFRIKVVVPPKVALVVNAEEEITSELCADLDVTRVEVNKIASQEAKNADRAQTRVVTDQTRPQQTPLTTSLP